MELKGKVKEVFDTMTFDSGFRKREFVVTTQEQYPQDIKMEVVKDMCDSLDNYKPGMDVSVQFNLKGREYQGKYFVNIQAWKMEIQKAGSNGKDPFQNDAIAANNPFETITAADLQEKDDDLPF